ncbi:MAG: hypothetical protein JW895_14045 [Thermoleophilaceae bacterium]|nr:hypothetical protein [Thermoleophilaceae bacterium]
MIATRGGVFKITDLSYSYTSGTNSVTVSGGHLKRIAGSGIDNNGYVNDDPNGYDALTHNRDFAHVAVLPGGDYALLTGCRLKLLKNTTETVYGKSFIAGRLYPLAGEGGGSQPDSNGAGGCRDSSGVLPQDGDGGLATAAGIDGSVYFDVDYQGGIYLPSNASHRVRYISPPDSQTGDRTIVSVAGSGDSRKDDGSFGGYGETVTSRPALGPHPSTGAEPLLGFKSGVTLFNENGYSGLLWSDTFVFTGIERGRIMFTTLKDTFNSQGQPSASSLVVQPFPLIP